MVENRKNLRRCPYVDNAIFRRNTTISDTTPWIEIFICVCLIIIKSKKRKLTFWTSGKANFFNKGRKIDFF